MLILILVFNRREENPNYQKKVALDTISRTCVNLLPQALGSKHFRLNTGSTEENDGKKDHVQEMA